MPFGNILIAEYIFIVNNVFDSPNLYITDTPTAKPRIHEGTKNGKKSYWLQPKDYEEFKDNWKIIGKT